MEVVSTSHDNAFVAEAFAIEVIRQTVVDGELVLGLVVSAVHVLMERKTVQNERQGGEQFGAQREDSNLLNMAVLEREGVAHVTITSEDCHARPASVREIYDHFPWSECQIMVSEWK